MAVQCVSIEQFLQLAATAPVLDVRSPGEYGHAHIPGAYALPLFSDDERKKIGTTYKWESRENAVKIGLEAFGPKMRGMVEEVEALIQKGKYAAQEGGNHTVLVHCWRGGMRSSAVAWLLDFYGFNVSLLEGGYKAYRNWVISHWQDGGAYRVLSGYTGAGKTEVLHALSLLGEPVIDLEALAGHKGSAFGGLDGKPQPSQEMFENLLATRIAKLRKAHGGKPIWIEDESQRIGDLNIPHEYFSNLAKADKIVMTVDFEQRLDTIVRQYGSYPVESLVNGIIRIKKRLGPLETKTAVTFLLDGEPRRCFEILLQYYDKHYRLHNGQGEYSVDANGKTGAEIARLIKISYP